MTACAIEIADSIFRVATPVLKIQGLELPLWKRKIEKNPKDARIGPWLSAKYAVLDDAAWRAKGACLYMARQSDGPIRYVGISRNGIKHRWRTSPAYDANTMARLGTDQLFHSQCWRHMQSTASSNPGWSLEVRNITHLDLSNALAQLGPPLSAFLALGDDGEGMCAAVERWLCNRSDGEFLAWNTAMTSRK